MVIENSARIYLLLFIGFIHGCASQAPTRTPDEVINSTHAISKDAQQSQRPVFKDISANATGDEIVAAAESLLGTPYLYGGASPTGFDCSGLVFYSYQTLGIPVGRTTKQQAKQITALAKQEIMPGDLLFFRTFGRNISHVGIYAGNNQFIHAPKSGKAVSYANIEQPYWRDRLVKAGRLH